MAAIIHTTFSKQDIGDILVIDDDASSLYLVQDLLASMGMGHKVTTASNATEAIGLLQDRLGTDQFPKLVILDIKMPNIDGFGFLEYLDTLDFSAHIAPKIVLLSYYGSRRYQELADYYGVSAYLRKPLTKEKVLDIISFKN